MILNNNNNNNNNNNTRQPSNKVYFFQFLRVSRGDQPLTKEPEGSGYEIEFNCGTRKIYNLLIERFFCAPSS